MFLKMPIYNIYQYLDKNFENIIEEKKNCD